MDWIEWIVKYWVTWSMGLLAAGITYLWRQAKKQKDAQKAIQDGVSALLRDRIIQMHMICKSKGFCSVQERESLEIMYTAYHVGLKKNGTLTGIYNSTLSMPYEKAERKEEE